MPRGARRPRHASPLTGYRRWRNRHGHHGRRRHPSQLAPVRRLARLAGWLLLAAGSVLVYLLAWQLISDTVSADSQRPPVERVRQVRQVPGQRQPPAVLGPAGGAEVVDRR